MRTEWLVIFLVSGAGTLLGGVLINMVPAGRPRPNVIPGVAGEPRVVVEARDAESQLRDLRSLQMARLKAGDGRRSGRAEARGDDRNLTPSSAMAQNTEAPEPVAPSSGGRWNSDPPLGLEPRRPIRGTASRPVVPKPRSVTPPEPARAHPERTPRTAELASAPATPAELPTPAPPRAMEPEPRRPAGLHTSAPRSSAVVAAPIIEPPSTVAASLTPPAQPPSSAIFVKPLRQPESVPAEPALSERVPAVATDPAALPVGEWQELVDDSQALPTYRILHRTAEYRSQRVFAEVYIPGLKPGMEKREIKRVAKAIAAYEGIDSMTMYCTLEARRADYSMDYADAHPEALAEGLLGRWERGWFKPYKP